MYATPYYIAVCAACGIRSRALLSRDLVPARCLCGSRKIKVDVCGCADQADLFADDIKPRLSDQRLEVLDGRA